MKDKVESLEEKAIVIQEPNDLAKPEKDTKFAGEAAKFLVDIIKKNNWSRRLGGTQEQIAKHLKVARSTIAMKYPKKKEANHG